jgi:hypothetical protein
MGALLIKTLILYQEAGMKGAIHKLDFQRHFSPEIRDWLMKPIASTMPSHSLPEPSAYVDYQL